ncbi:peptidoglycan editing factor PgeF [Cognatishimia sp. SS12]|uniref:peptidoglycan editing factor PgeF n=1 Tax=Cognatishimia sp. SS12 TaxID=2979465 RepID=UPI00232C1BF3|nr:peptidoglycan editing factor PgeF [Cognatishimia sp. SS12]MDC0738245.1 peptidoglycan editing factor PgeF [Cognatishimia sp. SS12]
MSIEILSSALLSPVRHGFFTRKGGASSGVFAGLNCGTGSSDQKEIVDINRARVAKAMDVAQLARIYQVHSADVATIDGSEDGLEKADAMVTATPGVALSILTADCQPVLFADRMNGVIGAAHAGWRGALDGVLENTVEAMIALGAARDEIVAVIGPTISQRAYEVGPEFLDEFMSADPEHGRFFAQGNGDRYHFDLPAFGLSRLRNARIADAEWIRHCTYSDPARFYSYRRATHHKEADYGRLISVIRI